MATDEMSDIRIRLLQEIAGKTAAEDLALRALSQPQRLSVMVDIMGSAKGTAKFACAKALLLMSESRPEAVYPYFDGIAQLLGSENNIIKWDAALIILFCDKKIDMFLSGKQSLPLRLKPQAASIERYLRQLDCR